MGGEIREIGMGQRVAAYVVSALAASVVYVIWTAVVSAFTPVGANQAAGLGELPFGFAFALGLWFMNGFAATMIAMIIPWALAVWARVKMQWDGRIYFPVAGAVLVFLIGCAVASLSPKLLIVEYQTFTEGALITAQRQGVCLVVCGIVFGACYWWVESRVAKS